MFVDTFFDFFLSSKFLFLLIVVFLVFLIFREFATWYWKINRIVKLLEEIEINTSFLRIKEETKSDSSKSSLTFLEKFQAKSNVKLSTVENSLIYITIFASFLLVMLVIYILSK